MLATNEISLNCGASFAWRGRQHLTDQTIPEGSNPRFHAADWFSSIFELIRQGRRLQPFCEQAIPGEVGMPRIRQRELRGRISPAAAPPAATGDCWVSAAKARQLSIPEASLAHSVFGTLKLRSCARPAIRVRLRRYVVFLQVSARMRLVKVEYLIDATTRYFWQNEAKFASIVSACQSQAKL
jgi:hypothetical protein